MKLEKSGKSEPEYTLAPWLVSGLQTVLRKAEEIQMFENKEKIRVKVTMMEQDIPSDWEELPFVPLAKIEEWEKQHGKHQTTSNRNDDGNVD